MRLGGASVMPAEKPRPMSGGIHAASPYERRCHKPQTDHDEHRDWRLTDYTEEHRAKVISDSRPIITPKVPARAAGPLSHENRPCSRFVMHTALAAPHHELGEVVCGQGRESYAKQ
jgi:hypothetical protein